MNALALLTALKQKNIQLLLQKGKLRIKAPKGAACEQTISQIREHKSELIRLLQKRADNALQIPKRKSDQRVKATVQQQSLWFIAKLAEQSNHYNLSRAYTLEGTLNKQALIKSLQHSYDRHEALRSSFYEEDGKVYQHVAETQPLQVEQKSITAEQLQQHISENQDQSMDLKNGPLFKATLLNFGHNQHMLLLCVHHIIIDGHSMATLLNELQNNYQTLNAQHTLPLNPPCQFIDYAAWHQHYYPEHSQDRDLDYWQQQYSEIPAAITLPIDKVRPATLSHNGAMRRYTLANELLVNLEQLSQQSSQTLFHTMLSAYAILLGRYSNSQDIVIGTPTANRNITAVEQCIGYFANVLAIRVKLPKQQTCTELMSTVKQSVIDAYDHQQLPLQQLVESLDIPREFGRAPLVQVAFAMQDQSSTELKLEHLKVSSQNTHSQTAKFELALYIEQSTEGVNCVWEFNSDLFDHQSIDVMATSFEQLLWNITKAADRPLSQLNLIDDVQRRTLLAKCNDIVTPDPNESGIDQTFSSIATKSPQAVALIYGDKKLTYGQLLQLSDQLAARLISKSIPTNQPIGICINRSFEMVIAMLAILKAGRGYVHLDHSLPLSRLNAIIDSADIGYCLVANQLQDIVLPSKLNIIDMSEPSSEKLPSGSVLTHPDQLAYINFSSGTTGTPKAIKLPHRGIARLVKEQNSYQLTSDTVMTHTSSAFFDAITLEIWGPLLNGGCCVLLENKPLECQSVKAAIEKHQINSMFLTTGLFHTLCSIDPSCFNGLKQLVIGGDILSPNHLVKVFQANDEIKIINGYGPTENTTLTTCYSVPRSILTKPLSPVPVGNPIYNTSVLVLDEQGVLLPPGCIGEICMGGDGLAIGYDDPALTAEKFIEHPYIKGQRLYRSGDLGRWDHNGLLMFIGRKDNQIKFNGFRIELEEIHLALMKHEQVKDAIALCHTDEHSKQHLTGYVVTHEQHIPSIYDSLSGVLPSYMIPTRLIAITTLPHTSTGKVDKRALLQLKQVVAPSHTNDEKLTKLQATVSEIFHQIVNPDQQQAIGLRQHFFRAGGHSLMAMQVISRINQHFQLTLPIKSLFENPTIYSISKVIEEKCKNRLTKTANLPKPVSIDANGVALSSMQYSLWLLAQTHETKTAYNVPINLKITGPLDSDLLIECLQKLYQRHEVLRTQVITIDNQPRQIINHQCQLNVEQLTTSLDRLNQVLHAEIDRVFDLEKGPLFCARLIQLTSQEHYLSLNMHHIICDGWSIKLLLQELGQLYRNHADLSTLAKMEIQYADYCHWQQAQLNGLAYNGSQQFWLETLKDAPELLELPTAKTRPQHSTANGAQFEFSIEQSLYQKIEQLSKQLDSTLFITTLTAFYLLIYRFCAQDDVVIGTPAANRHLTMLESTIGYFVNPLPLRCHINSSLTFAEQLQQVKSTLLQAFEHQNYPFTDLVKTLSLSHNPSYSPVFQMMFDLQEQNSEALQLPGLTAQMQRVAITKSKFDLTFSMIRSQDQLSGSIEYNTDIYNEKDITQLANAYCVLLESICHLSTAKISQLPLLNPIEQQQLLSIGTGKVNHYAPTTLHQLVETQATRTPQHTAIIFDDIELSYQQFNAQANRLANYILEQSSEPQPLIGLYCNRSIDMMIGLLAILKTGAAYVPLDPSYPANRLSHMINDSGISLIVADQNAADKLRLQNAIWVNVDSQTTKTQIEQYQSSHITLPNINDPENPAYVIYTSGSTGQPKGVVVSHRAIGNHIQAMAEYLQCTDNDKLLQFASVSFDTFIEQTFVGLSVGASIYFRNDNVLTPEEFYGKVIQHQITITDLSPLYLASLIAEPPTIEQRHNWPLKKIVIGGDVCSGQLVKNWFASSLSEDCQLFNAYGPTEAVITTTIEAIEKTNNKVAIGSAFTNKKLYVLDHDGQLSPHAVAGELYIGGDVLATGYLNQPQLTKSRFIKDPFSQDNSSFIYRTGDRVRWLDNGKLTFLGRTDKQIKIRGFRIEPAEIEQILLMSPEVEEALVIEKTRADSDKILVAYVVVKQEKVDINQLEIQLNERLSEQLPAHMIPTAIVAITEFKQTSNGKVDHDQLPMPALEKPSLQQIRNPTETILCDIWRDILGIDNIGLNDSFFKLGGHSVLMLKLKRRLESKFNISVDHVDIMTNATVAKQAQLIQRKVSG